MLFIDLDETLVRTVRRHSNDPHDHVIHDAPPDYEVRVGGAVYDVYLRPDLYHLWWSHLPFILFSAGGRDYVKKMAYLLRDEVRLNIRGWLSRYQMSDVGPSIPLTERTAVLVDERHFTDPVVRYKMGRLPNAVHVRIDPWDLNEETRMLVTRRTAMSKPLFFVILQIRQLLNIKPQQISRMKRAVLTKEAFHPLTFRVRTIPGSAGEVDVPEGLKGSK
jgi:hypothetical protein